MSQSKPSQKISIFESRFIVNVISERWKQRGEQILALSGAVELSELPVVLLRLLICCVICQVMHKPLWERNFSIKLVAEIFASKASRTLSETCKASGTKHKMGKQLCFMRKDSSVTESTEIDQFSPKFAPSPLVCEQSARTIFK